MPRAALDPLILKVVVVATEFGHAWCWHVGFAAALLVVCLLPASNMQTAASTALALFTLVSLGWVGHAVMDMGGVAIHEINQMVHLVAAGLWLGGLVPLGILLHQATRPGGGEYVPLARAALPHFSQMGYAAVALVALTGLVNCVFLVGTFRALVVTPYGKLLMLKIAVFGAMVGLALLNRFRLAPRLRDAAEARPAAASAMRLGRGRAGARRRDPCRRRGARHLGASDPFDLQDAMRGGRWPPHR